MFGFKKNEKPTLIIEAKDLMEIINLGRMGGSVCVRRYGRACGLGVG